MDWNQLIQQITNWAVNHGSRILIALLLLFVSFRFINYSGKKIQRQLEKKDADKTLVRTLVYVGKIVLKTVVVVCLIGYVGIDTSGLTALIASLGVGVGLAMNGALGNFAGGVLILFSRPFRIDDYIEVDGHEGTVEDIRLVSTHIRTYDNRLIVIPNSIASGAIVINYTAKDIRRVDSAFQIAYTADREEAKSALRAMCGKNPKILSDPEPFVRVNANNPSSVEIIVRAWVKNEDYWEVYYDLLEDGKAALDEAGIPIALPGLNVHMDHFPAEKSEEEIKD